MSAAQPDTEIFFFDEGRFGLMPTTGRFWTKKSVRPVVKVQTRYANFYTYSAVSPLTGASFSLFLPRVNAAMMNLYLKEMSANLSGSPCLLVMDGAGWHKSKDLIIPDNIQILFLPPYSPELNPVERLWRWLKRHSLRNRFHQNIENLMDAVQILLQQASYVFLQSLCSCKYLTHYE